MTGVAGRDKIAPASRPENGMTQRNQSSGLASSIPGVKLLGGLLPEKAASTFLNRWLRRGLLASFGVGFTVPYLAILNDVHVEGDEILKDLPRRNVVFLANHQTYFLEALAFFDLVYVRYQLPLENPVLRFSAAEETMKKNLLTKLMTLAGGVTFRRSFREGGVDVQPPGGHGRRRPRRGGDPGRLAAALPRRHHEEGRAPALRGLAAPAQHEGGGAAGARRRLPRPAPAQAGAGQALQALLAEDPPAPRPRRLLREALPPRRRRSSPPPPGRHDRRRPE